MKPPGAPWPQYLADIEATWGVHLSFYDLGGRLVPLLGSGMIHHRSAPCRAAKALGLRSCMDFESRAYHQLKGPGPAFLWKICRHGIAELALPLRVGSVFEGMVFVGGFSQAFDPVGARSKGLPKPASGTKTPMGGAPNVLCETPGDFLARGLPPMPQSRESLERLSLALVAEIAADMERVARRSPDRRDRVDHFFEKRFRQNVGLGDLARDLGLSATGTSDYLRKHLKSSFLGLLHRRRLAYAQALLAHSEDTLDSVALACGYESSRSFDKAFRRLLGMAPGRWRRGVKERV